MSTGDFVPALEGFFGSDAGLSASTIQRLTEGWQTEHVNWTRRDLSKVDYVYWWADGIWFNVRLPDPDGNQDRLCCLVIVGVRPDGRKELVAVTDGYRESTDSWADLLRDLRDRGLRAPTLAVGDGALGLWAALRDVFDGQVAEQRCWVHKTANVLDALPKRLHRDVKPAIHRIYLAETRTDAVDAVADFAEMFKNHPKAVAKITGELDSLLEFYDYPAEHWKHLRSTNAIQSTFATVRLTTKVTQRSRQPPGPPWPWPTSSVTPPKTDGDGKTEMAKTAPIGASGPTGCDEGPRSRRYLGSLRVDTSDLADSSRWPQPLHLHDQLDGGQELSPHRHLGSVAGREGKGLQSPQCLLG